MRHDEVHPATSTAVAAEIAPLKDLKDYQVAKGDPDVRGWEVAGRDGRRVGKVNDLLVDTGAMRVRYLDVVLDPDLLASAPRVPGTAPVVGTYAAPGMAGAGPVVDRDRGLPDDGHHVLIPIGSAQLDEDHDRVLLEGLDSHDTVLLPAYDHRAFNREYETGLRQRFDRGYTPAADRDFYTGDLYDEERFYGPRRRRGLRRP